MQKESVKGFTLVELMVTLALAVIVVTMAVPSFTSAIKNNRLVTQTNAIATDINVARSEAVKRSKQVALCRTADPNAGTPACGGTANTWTTGWLVFVDENEDAAFNTGDGDVLLKVGQPAGGDLTLITDAEANSDFVYRPDGSSGESSTAVFAVCDDRGGTYGREIQITTVGRPQLTKGSSGSAIDCDPS